MDFLARGTEIRDGVRISKKAASGEHWQIYETNCKSIVLAVSPDLCAKWEKTFDLSETLFKLEDQLNCCRILEGKADYLISSLSQGPFPDRAIQVEAFSLSFRQAKGRGAMNAAKDAIYIEEYSLILPVEEEAPEMDKLYVHWISGGIDLGADSFDHISRVMSWIPRDNLKRCFELAGYAVSEIQGEESGEIEYNTAKTKDDAVDLRERTGHSKTDSAQEEKIFLQKDKGEFSLPGRPALEQFFRENIIEVVLHREAYERMGISFPGATVLYGPPGSGKTYAVDRLAEYLGWERFEIDSGSIGSSYIHETSKKIAEIFSKAMEHAPSILIIDEMEAFLSERSASGSANNHHLEEVAEFLRKIPEAVDKGVLIFAMTNMIESIDPAIIRRGRFDHMVKVDYATKEEMRAFLEKRLKELPIAGDVEIESLAERLDAHPMSDAVFVLKEAGRLAVRRGLEEINNACLNDAVNQLPKKENKRKIGF